MEVILQNPEHSFERSPQMNIKRMADQYRAQVNSTGHYLKNTIISYLEIHFSKKEISEIRMDIKRWYNHLRKALGSEKDLKDLQKVWEYLVILNDSPYDCAQKRSLIINRIQKHMKKFLEKLPRLIEKSLTRSVRESGIRLR